MALDALVAGRDRVAAAAGSAALVDAALGDLEDTFTGLTGQPATRSPGRMYGARQLVYEDCRRDLEVTIGGALLDGLAEALPAILAGSRWFVGEVTTAVQEMLAEAVAAARRENGAGPVPLGSGRGPAPFRPSVLGRRRGTRPSLTVSGRRRLAFSNGGPR